MQNCINTFLDREKERMRKRRRERERERERERDKREIVRESNKISKREINRVR